MENTIAKRNHVKVLGEGQQPMMFAHGFGCDQNMWRFMTPDFQKDYKIVLFDYVGSGNSDITCYNPERYSDLNGYAEDVLDICKELGLKDIIFVGHSVSGMIGVLAAIKRPELFSRLIFVSPSAKYINDDSGYIGGFERKDIDELLDTMDKNYIGWANFLAPVVMRNDDRPELKEELNDSFCSTDPVIARRFAEVTFYSDNRPDLKHIKTPSLILQCTDDLIAPMEVGEYLHKHISQSTLKILQVEGHCPHMSDPAETIAAIKDYL